MVVDGQVCAAKGSWREKEALGEAAAGRSLYLRASHVGVTAENCRVVDILVWC